MNIRFLFPLRHRGWYCLLAAALVSAGCSSSSMKAKLTGKVIVGTENMDGGTLTFIPVNEADLGGNSTQIDAEGNYSVTLYKPGKMKVYVTPPAPFPTIPAGKRLGPPSNVPVPENVTTTAPPPRKPAVTVPKKYTDPKLTDRIVDVEPGTHVINIEFKK